MQFTGLSLLTWLIVAWGVVLSILVLLMIYRGMIGMHQEDQLFLSAGEHHFEAESAVAAARVAKLRPYILSTGVLAALLTASVIAVVVMQAMQTF
ncbi:MAG TPA: hypothetical protein VIC54_07165 [Terriglobales bacterium]|jgi:hypothetical protein